MSYQKSHEVADRIADKVKARQKATVGQPCFRGSKNLVSEEDVWPQSYGALTAYLGFAIEEIGRLGGDEAVQAFADRFAGESKELT